MANMGLRLYGPEIRKAILFWARHHLTGAKNIVVSDQMVLDGINRAIGNEQESWIYVDFDSEKTA